MFRPRCSLFFFISLLSLPLVQLPFHVSFPFRSFLLYSCRQAWSSVVLLPRFTAIGIVAIAVLTDLGYVVAEILGRLRAESRQAYQRRLSQIYQNVGNKCWYNRGTNFKNFHCKNRCNIFKSKIIENIFCKQILY